MNQSERNKKRLVVPMKRKALKNCTDGNQRRGSRNESVAGLSIQIQFSIKIFMDCMSHPVGRFLSDGRFRCVGQANLQNEQGDYENKISYPGLCLFTIANRAK